MSDEQSELDGFNDSFGEHFNQVLFQHQADIGRVAITWNKLLHLLSTIFAVTVTPDNRSVGYAVWNAIRADRQQWQVLKAALAVVYPPENGEKPKVREEFDWVIDKLESLSLKRNNTIHSPYEIGIEGGALKIFPADYSGNRMAKELAGKDLAKECRIIVESLEALHAYTQKLGSHLRTGRWDRAGLVWPERPKL